MIQTWRPNTSFTAGTWVSHDGQYYQVLATHTSGDTFDSTKFGVPTTELPGSPRTDTAARPTTPKPPEPATPQKLVEWAPNVLYKQGTPVRTSDGKLYQVTVQHKSSRVFDPSNFAPLNPVVVKEMRARGEKV